MLEKEANAFEYLEGTRSHSNHVPTNFSSIIHLVKIIIRAEAHNLLIEIMTIDRFDLIETQVSFLFSRNCIFVFTLSLRCSPIGSIKQPQRALNTASLIN